MVVLVWRVHGMWLHAAIESAWFLNRPLVCQSVRRKAISPKSGKGKGRENALGGIGGEGGCGWLCDGTVCARLAEEWSVWDVSMFPLGDKLVRKATHVGLNGRKLSISQTGLPGDTRGRDSSKSSRAPC